MTKKRNMKKFIVTCKKIAMICVVIGMAIFVGCKDFVSDNNEFNTRKENEKLALEYNHKASQYASRKEYKEAAECYLKAAELGYHLAQRTIAEWYEEGKGVAKDQKKALTWYKKAAEQGDAKSQFVLGRWYEDGYVVEKNLNEAARWYYQAAAQGYQYGSASKRYDNVIKMGATPPTDVIEKDRKMKEPQFLKKTAALVKNKFGLAGVIIMLVVSIIVFIVYGKIEKALSYRRINFWAAPILFAIGAVVLWATEGFYAPGIEKFVLYLFIFAMIYQSYQIIKTSESFFIIMLRIAISFIVSMFCFYAAAVATILMPLIILILFIKGILTPQSSRGSGKSSSSSSHSTSGELCRTCTYYPGFGRNCNYNGKSTMVNDNTTACSRWQRG